MQARDLATNSNRKNLHYKFQIFPGNNSELVERVFTEGCPRRSEVWYDLGNKQQNHYHFRWAPISKSINFERLSHNFTQIANHFEGHAELSRKHELFKNIRYHIETLNSKSKQQSAITSSPAPMLFQVMPLQFHIRINPPPNLTGYNPNSFLPPPALCPSDPKSVKIVNAHIKAQMIQFKRVFYLLDEYRRHKE